MKKILIVEDDQGIMDVLRLMLEMRGYEVATVFRGGKEMDMKLKKNKPNLILLDMLLSGADGRDITRKLKNSRYKNIPVIMLSAHPNAKKSVLEAGANDFIAKPFGMHDLLSKVSKHLI